MSIGLLYIEMGIPFASSLKEKRSSIKPLLHRLHREFNVSVCEFAHQEDTKSTVIACSMISDSRIFIEKEFARIISFLPRKFADLEINSHSTEYFKAKQ